MEGFLGGSWALTRLMSRALLAITLFRVLPVRSPLLSTHEAPSRVMTRCSENKTPWASCTQTQPTVTRRFRGPSGKVREHPLVKTSSKSNLGHTEMSAKDSDEGKSGRVLLLK